MKASYFEKIYDNKPSKETSIFEFLNNVKQGTWRKLIEPINTEKDKEKRNKLKSNTLPYVTISGTFSTRKKAELVEHSGFICLDIDDSLDLVRDWQNIKSDPHTFGAFRSASGLGFAVLVKIEPGQHLETFLSLEKYYLENYQIIIDKACKDVTRPRFVSYDPETVINETAKLFKATTKRQNVRKIPQLITGKSDIDYLIEQIQANRVDLTRGAYSAFLEIGFSLASEYNESGRQYFHAICQFSEKYSQQNCDKQFDHCLRSGGSGITIGTLFYYAKEANLDLVSPQTKHIVAVAKQGKRGGRNSQDVVKLLETVDGLKKNDVQEVVDKVFNTSVDLKLTEELTKLEQLELFIRNNYNLKRNEVTRYIENNGAEVDTIFSNSVYFQARRIVADNIPFETVERLISSDFIPNYNPLQEFFENNAHRKPEGLIKKLAECIETDTGMSGDNFDPQYKYKFIKKWLVGIVASVFGNHSPLLLVLTGGQNTGKTEYFRRLLPAELKPYYAESKLDAGKDDEILMTQKLLIMDDELGGKSKQEAKRLKELTSKADFTLREPYGRKNVRLRRLAVLCGTSNDELVLNDPTGNRRIVPLNVLSINHDLYNSIDKADLFAEVYNEYLAGYNWQLDGDDVKQLNQSTGEFEQIRHERELIAHYFKTPEFRQGYESTVLMTATEIKTEIEALSGQKLSQWKIGQELKALGFEQQIKKVFGKTSRLYSVVKIDVEKLDKEKAEITTSDVVKNTAF